MTKSRECSLRYLGWRLHLAIHMRHPRLWAIPKNAKWLVPNCVPLTDKDIERGQQLAKELGLS